MQERAQTPEYVIYVVMMVIHAKSGLCLSRQYDNVRRAYMSVLQERLCQKV